jgi:positive regulator of sigma E activity
MRISERGRRTSSAVLIYVIILMGMQVFLVTVAAEAFLADEASLAWATAVVSVVLFAFAAGFLRYLRP